ncbi:hypothetical protein YM304_06530 [Ilumatobacter coccineus YM16-304]|uniref:Uncharacterized protein n=1 Tax=Ilumatobacter coccineus (strain NBRC 103263 / KCTC 29153 / YM16-304) TaxID=1313172 RepID=A0A6C7E172_ILUCY|nr:hypothetical protein YM304_06530 [Ilumatobacter coccineus YM16-304]
MVCERRRGHSELPSHSSSSPAPRRPWMPICRRARVEIGLPETCVIGCDEVVIVPSDAVDGRPVGCLG